LIDLIDMIDQSISRVALDTGLIIIVYCTW